MTLRLPLLWQPFGHLKGGFEMKESLSSKDRKQLAKQRKDAAKQAQKYHKEQEKKSKNR